jgi:hypothetical protein
VSEIKSDMEKKRVRAVKNRTEIERYRMKHRVEEIERESEKVVL